MATTAKAKKTEKKETRGKSGVVKTPVVRVSFPYVEKPDSGREYSDDKYKITGFLPKEREEELKPLKRACLEAAKQIWPDAKFNQLEHPFKDGDESKHDYLAGQIYFQAKTNNKPGVVGPDLQPLAEGEHVYGGCFAKFSMVAFTYTRPGEIVEVANGKRTKKKETIKGVSFALNNVQFIRDGERLGGGGSSPEDDFEAIDPAEYEEIEEGENFEDAEGAETSDNDEDDEGIL